MGFDRVIVCSIVFGVFDKMLPKWYWAFCKSCQINIESFYKSCQNNIWAFYKMLANNIGLDNILRFYKKNFHVAMGLARVPYSNGHCNNAM